MRRIAWMSLIVFGCALVASGQQSAPPAVDAPVIAKVPVADQPSKEQLMHLFDAMHIRAQMDTMLKAFPRALQQQMKSQIDAMEASVPGGAKITPEQRESIDKAVAKYMDEAFRLYPVDEMMDDMVPVYQEYLTREDVEGILAFYQSPAGQHLLEKQPAMMQAIMPVTMAKMQERSKELTSRMMKEMMATLPGAPRDGQK